MPLQALVLCPVICAQSSLAERLIRASKTVVQSKDAADAGPPALTQATVLRTSSVRVSETPLLTTLDAKA